MLNIDQHFQYLPGITPVLLHEDGTPTGIPVQQSKNWHTPDIYKLNANNRRVVHDGVWFSASTVLRIPRSSSLRLVLRLVYAYHNSLPAVSHAQLSLIGSPKYGNGLFHASALGVGGENTCYEPMGQQNAAEVAEVRPLLVCGATAGTHCAKNARTNNIGGGSFLVYTDGANVRQYQRNVQADVRASGPVMSDVVYTGTTLDGAIDVEVQVNLVQTDSYLKNIHRFRYTVKRNTTASRLALYSVDMDQSVTGALGSGLHGAPEHIIPSDAFDGTTSPRYLANYTQRPCGQGSSHGAWGHCWFYLAGAAKPDSLGASAHRGLVVRHWEASVALPVSEMAPNIVI